MKITLLLLIVFIFSCSKNNKRESSFDSTSTNLLIGEWMLDSSSNSCFYRDWIYFDKNLNFYQFDRNDGGSLAERGKLINHKAILNQNKDTLSIEIIDSNYFSIQRNWGNTINYYKKYPDEKFEEDLLENLKEDSLRTAIIGWWKLYSNHDFIKLPNSSIPFSTFTLQFNDRGIATFYLNNYLDSTVSYSYQTNSDGVGLASGCTISTNYISFNENGDLLLVMRRRFDDTLRMKRIYALD